MKYSFNYRGILVRIILIVILTTPLLLTNNHCKIGGGKENDERDSIRPYVQYNILHTKESTQSSWISNINRIKGILEDSIAAFNARNNEHVSLLFNAYYCPCDSGLVNIDAKTVAGVSVNPPPPPPPPPAGSGEGDSLVVRNISMGFDGNNAEDTTHGLNINLKPPKASKVMAIIDTGLDTLFLNPGIGKLLWKDPIRPTMYNFMPGENLNELVDDHPNKHGTRVTSLAIEPSSRGQQMPGIMILKALDSNKLGSVFTVSCAMSYAIQNNATIINASLGYETVGNQASDPILQNYISRSNGKQIPVFAAAGNVLSGQLNNECSIRTDNRNQLGDNKLFYPACLSKDFNYVISVAGLKAMDTACANQNYSSDYVSVGLLNKKECCRYGLQGSTGVWNKGSSFATPIVAGMVMNIIVNSGINLDPLSVLADLERTIDPGKIPVTKGGKFIFRDDR
jgi:hypothetical protein